MGFLQDLRFALRVITRKPGFTAVVVLTLAIGIGAGSSMFSIIHRLLMRPVDFPEVDRLVSVQTSWNNHDYDNSVSPRAFLDLQTQAQSFSQLAAFQYWEAPLAGDGDPEQVLAYQVSPGWFGMFGVPPELGRDFAADEVDGQKENVVILGHALWDRRYGRDPGILGKSVTLAGASYVVVGVMPDSVRFPNGVELWAPLTLTPDQRKDRRGQYLGLIGHLKPGVTVAAADAEMRLIGQRDAASYPELKGHTQRAVTLIRGVTEDYTRNFIYILLGAALLLLLIACANVANLFLAHALSRRRELAVRAALGAGRRRIVRQLLTEAVVLGVGASLVSLLFATWAVELVKGSMPARIVRFIPGWDAMGLNPVVLGFALGVGVLVGLVFGVVPALQVSRTDLNAVLKDGDRGSTSGGGTHRVRAALVVAQIALALILLLGGGALLKGFLTQANPDAGVDGHNVLTMMVNLPQARELRPQEEILAFERPVLERLRALPGVTAAAVVSNVPWGDNGQQRTLFAEGRPVTKEDEVAVDYRPASPGYLELLRVPRLEGRGLEERDAAAAPKVALLSSTAAARLFPGGSPLGKRFRFKPEDSAPWWTVVGVVGDVRDRIEQSGPRPAIYVPFEQAATSRMYLVLKTSAAPLAMAHAAQQAVYSVDPAQPVTQVRTLEMVLSERLAGIRIGTWMMAAFAFLALILAVIGIYGVVATLVTQRTHEIGVRMALGAQRIDVLGLVLRRGVLLTGAGVLIGLGAGIALVRFLASVLGSAIANDMMVFVIFTTAVTAVAMLGSLVPAWRATKVDPLQALRGD